MGVKSLEQGLIQWGSWPKTKRLCHFFSHNPLFCYLEKIQTYFIHPVVLKGLVSPCVRLVPSPCLLSQQTLILRMKALRWLSSFYGIILSSVFHNVSYLPAHISQEKTINLVLYWFICCECYKSVKPPYYSTLPQLHNFIPLIECPQLRYNTNRLETSLVLHLHKFFQSFQKLVPMSFIGVCNGMIWDHERLKSLPDLPVQKDC